MLIVSNVSKQFRGAEAPILTNISLTVNAGERVGLIGANGSGKSTLLNIITRQIPPDSGSVGFLPSSLRVGYLPQGLTVPEETPVYDVLFPQANAVRDAEANVTRLAEAMAESHNGDLDALMAAYSQALERLEKLGYAPDVTAGLEMLAHLGLGDVTLDTPAGTLSGGQKTRLNLAALLLNAPQLLILDEPTNHLDVTALEWLETWLTGFAGGVLIVSHDRAFLDRVVNRVVALDDKTHTARLFAGGYSDYLATMEAERSKQRAQWRDQEDEIARLEADEQRWKDRALRKENATNNDHQRRLAKKVAKRGKAKEKRLEQYLASDERVDKPEREWQVKLDFGDVAATSREVLTLENLTIGYDSTAPLLSNINLTLRAGERIAIMGPNGHGKSTLLKTIIGELPPLSGRVRAAGSVHTGYLAQEQEILDPRSTPLDTLLNEVRLSQTEARSFLHFFLFAGDEVFRRVGDLSYGERSRLMLALLVARGANLLIMDEPLNHLDLPSREKFEHAMQNFKGSVLAVMHDRYFVEKFATGIWFIENGALTVQHVRVAG